MTIMMIIIIIDYNGYDGDASIFVTTQQGYDYIGPTSGTLRSTLKFIH